jgi:hypothetical protein
MRLENLCELPYSERVRTFGNWCVSDIGLAGKGSTVVYREFSYHGTVMLIVGRRFPADGWSVVEARIGWGSASEQKGVNRILRGAGITTHYYRRNGGNPRYEVV